MSLKMFYHSCRYLLLNSNTTSLQFLIFRFSMNQWAGKVALVTGASKGIGSMLSSILVSAEMDVVGCARSFEESHTISQCKAFAVNGVAFHPVR